MDSASSIISQTRSIESSFVRMVLSDSEDSSFIDTYQKYDSVFRIRHDFVHWCVCKQRGVPFGEKHLFEIPELKTLELHRNWELIKMQSPDIIEVKSNVIKIVEITVSSSRLAKREKITKYALMIDIMKKMGFTVDIEIIAVGSNISEPGIITLSNDHGLSLDISTEIYTVVSRITRLIHAVESTLNGQYWNIRRSKDTKREFSLGISDKDIKDYHKQSKFKCFSDKNLKNMLKTNVFDSYLDDDDDIFLDKVAEKALNMKTKLNQHEDFESAIRLLKEYHNKFSNTTKYRSFLPLPFLNKLITDSSNRTTELDEDLFIKFKSRLLLSGDSFFMKLSQMQNHMDKIKLSHSEKLNIALEGPGRKHFIALGSAEHIKRQKHHKNYWFNYQQVGYERSLESLSFSLSKVTSFNKDDPVSSGGMGLDYIKCCQSIFRELIINSMRKDRRHMFIFKPTGVDGVYILIFPGPKLRTGENLSTIWFKLFTTPEYIPIDESSNHWAFKSWNNSGSFLHSNWISIDANRLDHYLRCYDRILMGYLSYQHHSDHHLELSVQSDTSNTLGIIILIYMENKRSTSKMLQDVRYLVMGSLSKFRWWKSLLEKYHEPVRSPLQAYLLSSIEKYSIHINTNLKAYISDFRFGKVYQESDVISDKLAGVMTSLPRVLTKGAPINFQQLLCEMYFTMLFNKNQDDPTHATFQILNKMLDGEESLQEVKLTTKLHTGGDNPIDDMNELVDNPHKNQFSKYAIMIGSKLQSLDQSNKSPAGLSHMKAAQNNYINKPISEFATYKSSAVFERSHYESKFRTKEVKQKKTLHVDGLEEKYREGGEDDEDPEHVVFTRQNPRRRCIEGIIDLLKNDKMRSFDVIKDDITNEMYFQVFKKNQIGGAREILILPIEKRITINILESFSRLICKEDEREMLTHGDIKLSMMRDIVRDVRRTETTKRIVLNYNFDKTRWGPSFMPIQFIYMFKPFAHHYKSLYNFLLLTLMVHTNKKCLIPEKLLNIWLNDPDNKIKHNEPNLQKIKDVFRETKQLYFDNESNMGQGILHYTSSYLHLCGLSFRDAIYKRLCKKLNVETGVWKDLVSSDDSYTAHALPMDSVKKINMRIELFMRSQEIMERLFNMWTSQSKSSISFLISEFNSMFGSNLTFFPTLFKFAIASVMPTNTDSFFRMVKESFNTSRQIVENGGSLELYMIAHRLNKNYCESIYHTYSGGVNDFKIHNLDRENVPYQLGVYPIKNPGILLVLGPESHNYEILNRFEKLTISEQNLFKTCHNLIPINNPELYSEMNSFDNIFTGMLRIEAATGPVRKLQRIKRQIDMSWDEMQQFIEKDITILLREPETIMEMKILTYQKLFSFGASESLRDTASSIYYARVAATVTATAFHIPYHNELSAHYDKDDKKMIGFTYHDCLSHLINNVNEFNDLHQYYPHMREFRDLMDLSKNEPDYIYRSRFETQNVRSLQMTEITMRIKNPIKELIECFWVRNKSEKPTSFFRDWITLKELVPVINDSLDLTLENFPGTRTQQIKVLLLILMRVMSYSNRPMKAVIFGPSSRTYDQTYLTLIQQNLFRNYTSNTLILNKNLESTPRIYDKLYYYFNIFMLAIYQNVKLILDYDGLPMDQYLRDPTITQSSKKRIMMMLMYEGFLDNYREWTRETKTIMHYWIQRQYRDKNNQYRGNFKLLLQMGSNKMHFSKINKKFFIGLQELKNPGVNYELLKYGCELVQVDVEEVKKNMNIGRFLILSDTIMPITDPNGVDVSIMNMSDIKIDVGKIKIITDNDIKNIVINDSDGYQIMKTPFGLMTTDYIPIKEEFKDFNVNGMSINKLSKIRIFSSEFDFANLPSDAIIDVIDDLVVERPKISDITVKRLSGLISSTWETKGLTDYFEDAEEKYVDENPLSLLMDSIITMDEFKQIIDIPEDEIYDGLLEPDFNWDVINNLPVIKAKFQPQKILDRVLNCKYHFIARSCIDPALLSKSAIKALYKQTGNIYITYSLVYLYDKLFTMRDNPSPSAIDISLRSNFSKKFKLFDDEFNLL